MGEVNNKRPRRRWLQFSLRTFLLVVAIFAIWLGFLVRSARRQQAAVEAIVQAGGRVDYDFERGESPVPDWLLSRLGVDFFHDVVSVHLSIMSDECVLEHLDAVPKLKNLWLAHLASDQEALRIARLDRLESLFVLDASKITDEAMRHFGGMRRLKILSLDLAMNVTDAGVEHLASLRHVEILSVSHAKLSDKSLRVVASMPRLKNLLMTICDITDAGLVHLADLRNLEVLDLSGTAVTNRGLEQLKGLKNLKVLSVVNTKVNDSSALQKALPNCTIFARRDKPMSPP